LVSKSELSISGKIRWFLQEACMGKMKYWYIILVEKPEGKINFGTQKVRGVIGSKIFKCILKNNKFCEELIAYSPR
jgi:hypothetical protein